MKPSYEVADVKEVVMNAPCLDKKRFELARLDCLGTGPPAALVS